jgi:hypothetical protein
MSGNTPQQLRLQWLALLVAFGCQFIGLAVAYVLSRSEGFSEGLARLAHSSVSYEGRLAVAFGMGLLIQAALSVTGYVLWPRRRGTP